MQSVPSTIVWGGRSCLSRWLLLLLPKHCLPACAKPDAAAAAADAAAAECCCRVARGTSRPEKRNHCVGYPVHPHGVI